MKKVLLFILSAGIYIFIWFLLTGCFIGINLAVYGRGVGGITGLGSVLALWFSYKFVKWIWIKVFCF